MTRSDASASRIRDAILASPVEETATGIGHGGLDGRGEQNGAHR
ncbi:hypothetical protein [Nocardia sp. CC227C]|nr:hypothetical protein [Nocardia sp. CC227C]